MTEAHEFQVLDSEKVYEGRVIALRRDTVAMPGGGDSVREVVHHPGAVAVVALDDQDRVVLLRQYRHPVGRHLWELPAGLRDADGEPPLETAKRVLAEEALLAARRWSLLVTVNNSPGFSDELVQIYLAEELRMSPSNTRWTASASGTRSRVMSASSCSTRKPSGRSTSLRSSAR